MRRESLHGGEPGSSRFPYVFLFALRKKGSPPNGPGSGAVYVGTNALRWFLHRAVFLGRGCGAWPRRQKAPHSEARGTAQGACGPLKKPRGFEGVARDSNIVDPERPYVTPFPVRAYRVSSSGLPI